MGQIQSFHYLTQREMVFLRKTYSVLWKTLLRQSHRSLPDYLLSMFSSAVIQTMLSDRCNLDTQLCLQISFKLVLRNRNNTPHLFEKRSSSGRPICFEEWHQSQIIDSIIESTQSSRENDGLIMPHIGQATMSIDCPQTNGFLCKITVENMTGERCKYIKGMNWIA